MKKRDSQNYIKYHLKIIPWIEPIFPILFWIFQLRKESPKTAQKNQLRILPKIEHIPDVSVEKSLKCIQKINEIFYPESNPFSQFYSGWFSREKRVSVLHHNKRRILPKSEHISQFCLGCFSQEKRVTRLHHNKRRILPKSEHIPNSVLGVSVKKRESQDYFKISTKNSTQDRTHFPIPFWIFQSRKEFQN